MEITISELQKKISIFKKLKTPIRIIDKKKNKVVATIFPNFNQNSIVDKIAGIFENYSKNVKIKDLKKIEQIAYEEELREKYGKISD